MKFKEGVSKLIGNKNENSKNNLLNKFQNIKDIRLFSIDFLRKTNVTIKNIQENSLDFNEMRKKLNTESGVVISNHPGTFDTETVFSLFDREDILFMAQDADKLSGTALEKKFIKAPHTPEDIQKAFHKVREHIASGGLFFMYPTGGQEDVGEEFLFKSGLKYMLTDGTLNKESMVYALNIGGEILDIPTEEKKDFKNPYFKYFFNQTTIAPKPIQVNLNEKYTRAGEWMESLEQEGDKNKLLTDHYLSLFK